jgi:AraC-like DNA-binding protein/TolB-like protein/Tfp pilus assembly protein PilF
MQTAGEGQFEERINQIVLENIDNEYFTVEELARRAGLSPSMLHRRLKKLTGKSSKAYITEIRLARARELIEEEDVTISEVAYKVGFKSPSYFIRVFKKYFKVSPGEYKSKPSVLPSQISFKQHKKVPGSYQVKTPGLISWISIIVMVFVLIGAGTVYLMMDTEAQEKSLAILPLQNLTGNPENEYLVDGMHDALIGQLGQIESLQVISRTSTLRYRNSEKSLQDIAKELDVNIIIEGSIAAAGDTIRIILQVIDVFPKERHLMSNEYYGEMGQVLRLHSSAVKDIAQNIKVNLTREEKQSLSDQRTVDPTTYRIYLRGIYHINQGTQESFDKGLDYLREVIEKDPADPFAYAGLALGYAIMGHGMVQSESAFRLARAAADKALILDPELDEAYTALALLYLYQSWDWALGKEAFEEAIARNPNNAVAHAHFAWYYVIAGAKEKSLYHARKAVTLEPMSPAYASWLAWLYYYYGDFENAELWAMESLTLNADLPYGNLILGWLYLREKKYQRALELHEKLPFNTPRWKWLRCRTYILSGNRDKAIAIWNDVNEYAEENWTNPFYIGMIAASLGYTDKAFELLNEACDKKYYPSYLIDIFPSVEFIRNDPRYTLLKHKLNLPDSDSFVAMKN